MNETSFSKTPGEEAWQAYSETKGLPLEERREALAEIREEKRDQLLLMADYFKGLKKRFDSDSSLTFRELEEELGQNIKRLNLTENQFHEILHAFGKVFFRRSVLSHFITNFESKTDSDDLNKNIPKILFGFEPQGNFKVARKTMHLEITTTDRSDMKNLMLGEDDQENANEKAARLNRVNVLYKRFSGLASTKVLHGEYGVKGVIPYVVMLQNLDGVDKHEDQHVLDTTLNEFYKFELAIKSIFEELDNKSKWNTFIEFITGEKKLDEKSFNKLEPIVTNIIVENIKTEFNAFFRNLPKSNFVGSIKRAITTFKAYSNLRYPQPQDPEAVSALIFEKYPESIAQNVEAVIEANLLEKGISQDVSRSASCDLVGQSMEKALPQIISISSAAEVLSNYNSDPQTIIWLFQMFDGDKMQSLVKLFGDKAFKDYKKLCETKKLT